MSDNNWISNGIFLGEYMLVVAPILMIVSIIGFVLSKRKKCTVLAVVCLAVIVISALDLALFAWLAFNWSTPPIDGVGDPASMVYRDAAGNPIDVSGNAIDW